MSERISRRRVVRMAVVPLGAIVGSHQARAGDISPQAACSWRLVSSKCSSGTIYEQWCYSCCDFSGCQTLRCEWRKTGVC